MNDIPDWLRDNGPLSQMPAHQTLRTQPEKRRVHLEHVAGINETTLEPPTTDSIERPGDAVQTVTEET